MKLTRIASLILVIAMILCTFSGCGKKEVPAVTFRDVIITESEYCYWMSYYKGFFLYQYFGTTTDNPQLWSSEISDGITVGKYLNALAVSNIMSLAVYLQLFDEYDLSLTTAELNQIDADIQKYISSAGSKSALNSTLSAYGINVDILRDVKIDQAKMTKLQNYLYGENGIERATGTEIKQYYNENYYRIKLIFTSSEQEFERDADGNVLYDEEKKSYKTRTLTTDEKVAKAVLADELEKRIAAGEDFDALMKEYTMEMGMIHFEDGYYISDTSSFVASEIKEAVKKLEIGETANVDVASGWYIVKRLELIDGAYEKDEYKEAMFGNLEDSVNAVKMQNLIAPYSEEIVISDQAIANYPLEYLYANFYY